MKDHRRLGEPVYVNQVGSNVYVPDWGHCCIVDLGVRRGLLRLRNGELEEVDLAELARWGSLPLQEIDLPLVDPEDPPL